MEELETPEEPELSVEVRASEMGLLKEQAITHYAKQRANFERELEEFVSVGLRFSKEEVLKLADAFFELAKDPETRKQLDPQSTKFVDYMSLACERSGILDPADFWSKVQDTEIPAYERPDVSSPIFSPAGADEEMKEESGPDEAVSSEDEV